MNTAFIDSRMSAPSAPAIEPVSREQTARPVVLRTHGLRKAFGGHRVLDEASLELRRGEVVLLRGDNGSGKTTLLNMLTGSLEPDAGTIEVFADNVVERFSFPRPWWARLNPFDHFSPERMAQECVARTWQEIRLFGTLDLCANLAVAIPGQAGENPALALLRRPKMHGQEQVNRESARVALAELGLGGREESSADMVSLGQAKRVAIARAVLGGAKILFLDEPLAGLDREGIGQVLKLLEALARDDQITLVIVEHVFHIPRLLEMVNTVWTLAAGKLRVEDPARVREEFRHPGRDELRLWLTQLAGPGGTIVDRPLDGGATLTTVVPSGPTGKSVLEVEGLVVHRGSRPVVGRNAGENGPGLSFVLHEGELGFLQAPNGWGKTTLLEAIAGLVPVTAGTVRLFGHPVLSLPPWERARRGLSSLQARNHTFPSLTVQETLRLANVHPVPPTLEHFRSRQTSALSGGERQRLALACAIKPNSPGLTLLDEPFGMLDQPGIHEAQQGITPNMGACLLAMPGIGGNPER